MAYYKDLEIEGTFRYDSSNGEITLTLGKLNNFADVVNVTVEDTVPTSYTEAVSVAARDYPTGKQDMPLGVVDAVGHGGLTQDDVWKVQLELSNTAGDEVLYYRFSFLASSTVDESFTFNIKGTSQKTK